MADKKTRSEPDKSQITAAAMIMQYWAQPRATGSCSMRYMGCAHALSLPTS